jgi:hypothetical protein
MLRTLLFHGIPLLMPFVIYGVYLYYHRRAGGTKSMQTETAAWLTLAGLILMIVSLFAVGLMSGEPKDGTYVPPRYEDGKIVPSQVLPPD